MTTTREVRIGDHKLKFIDGAPAIVTAGTDQADYLTIEDLGAIAEFAAEAWLALADEEYNPVVISERGYVAQDSIEMSSDPGPGGESYGSAHFLERDCE